MPELPAGSRNRWFHLRLPGDGRDTQLWAERFFATQAEAFDYYEHRRAEHPTGRVHPPVKAQEPPPLRRVRGSRLMGLVPYPAAVPLDAIKRLLDPARELLQPLLRFTLNDRVNVAPGRVRVCLNVLAVVADAG